MQCIIRPGKKAIKFATPKIFGQKKTPRNKVCTRGMNGLSEVYLKNVHIIYVDDWARIILSLQGNYLGDRITQKKPGVFVDLTCEFLPLNIWYVHIDSTLAYMKPS